MKKLLITSMAAVAVSICAKADFTANESFEGYTNEGPLFQTRTDNQNQEAYAVTPGWVTAATPEDGIFTVTNIENYVGAGTHAAVSRPIDATPNAKALAIDTSKPLMRNAVTGDNSQTGYVMTGDESIFFDSVVQFTATEAAPTPDSANGDKLMVWLYASDDVDNDNPGVFGETTPITSLVITAGYGDDQIATNYLTNLGVVPETWHRLTIKALNDIDPDADSVVPGFEVRLDGELVSGVLDYQNNAAASVTTFPSLMASDTEGNNNIIGVAFDGKGAVDDLVFTTADPFAGGGGEEPEPEDQTANVEIEFNNLAAIVDGNEGGIVFTVNNDEENQHYISTLSTNFVLNVGSSASLQFVLNEGYELESPDNASYDEGVYTITINELTSDGATIEIVATSTGGGDNGPTVGDTTYATEEALKAVVKSGTDITVPSGWSVDGKVLKKADGTPFATFEYYNLALADGIVTATLDQKAAAPFAEATDLDDDEEVLELDATIEEEGVQVPAVGVCIKTYSGLWYGLGTATELGKWGQLGADDWVPGNGSKLQLKAKKPDGNAAFFMIKVRDTNPKQ